MKSRTLTFGQSAPGRETEGRKLIFITKLIKLIQDCVVCVYLNSPASLRPSLSEENCAVCQCHVLNLL